MGASQESWVSPPICLLKLDLGKVTPTDIESFQSCIESYLCSINFCNYGVICCSDAACDRSDHKAEIESLYHHSCNCVINATKQCISQRRPNSNFKKCVTVWNEYVYEAKAAASDAYYLWCQWNKPKFGPLLTHATYTGQVQICYALLPSTGKTNPGWYFGSAFV